MSTRRRRGWTWLSLVIAVLATLYCYSGVVMNADFAMMGSAAQSAGHVLAAKIFAGLTLVGIASTLLCVVVLWRTRPPRTSHI